ncbi:hypothetical protein [Pontibacter diazotrophicus]|nr:hypothetical protein [Pontibacter diazotrophicus]
MDPTQILERELGNRQKLLRLFEASKMNRKVPAALLAEIAEIKITLKSLRQLQAKAIKRKYKAL